MITSRRTLVLAIDKYDPAARFLFGILNLKLASIVILALFYEFTEDEPI